VTVTDNSTGGANCSLTDTATLTTVTTGTTVSAQSTVTFCDLRQHLDSCLQDEAVLGAFINGRTGPSLQAGYLTQLLDLINQLRASVSTSANPVPPLTRLQVLDTAAQGYSQKLVGSDPTMLSHTLDGDPTSRVMSAGYNPAVVGENLAAGQWSPQEVIDAWVQNPGQYNNLINPNFTQVGLGLSGGAAGSESFVLYWVADFGSPSSGSYDSTAAAPAPQVDVRAIVAQLHADLQVADAALCQPLGDSDNGPLLAAIETFGSDIINLVQVPTGEFSPQEIAGVCLQDVLGFYAATNSASYTPSLTYISAFLLD
jgi:uncharacterized protein YkwD